MPRSLKTKAFHVLWTLIERGQTEYTALVFAPTQKTAWLIMTGNWKWTEDIRRNTFRIWNAGMGMAVVGATFIWGIGGAIGAWPIWLLCAVVFVGATALQDLWAGIGWFKHNKPERTITHKDGSQAVVDSQDKGYRRIQRREM